MVPEYIIIAMGAIYSFKCSIITVHLGLYSYSARVLEYHILHFTLTADFIVHRPGLYLWHMFES